MSRTNRARRICVAAGLGMLASAALLVGMSAGWLPIAWSQESQAAPTQEPFPISEQLQKVDLLRQSPEEAASDRLEIAACVIE